MTVEVYQFVISIAGVIILLLISVIIWASKRLFDNVSTLLLKVGKIETSLENKDKSCVKDMKLVNQRISRHSSAIKSMTTSLAVLTIKIDNK